MAKNIHRVGKMWHQSERLLASLYNRYDQLLQIFSTVTATISAEVLNVLREKIEQIISASGTHVKLAGETLESSSWSDMQIIHRLLLAEANTVNSEEKLPQFSSSHENETLFVLKVFPDTKTTGGQVTSISEDGGRTASSRTKGCDGTEGDDEPVQRFFVCRECKAFFNDPTALFDHQKLHRTLNATENKVSDDNFRQAELTSTGNSITNARNADGKFMYKKTRKSFLTQCFVVNKANDQLVICKAVGVSRRSAKGSTSKATCDICKWSGSDSDLSNHLENLHSTVLFECAECSHRFQTFLLLKSHFTHHLAKGYLRTRNLSKSSRRSIEKARSTLTKLGRKSITRERAEKHLCKQCGLSLRRHMRKHGVDFFRQNEREKLMRVYYEPFSTDSTFTINKNRETIIDVNKIYVNERRKCRMVYRTLNNELPGEIREFPKGNTSNYKCSLCGSHSTQPKAGIYHLIKDHTPLPDERIVGQRQIDSKKRLESGDAKNIVRNKDESAVRSPQKKNTEKLVRCQKCDFKISTDVVESHMNFFHPLIAYVCGVCKQEFAFVGDLKEHFADHLEKAGIKAKPDKNWRVGYSYKEGEPQFLCTLCNKKFHRRVDLVKHGSKHVQKVVTPEDLQCPDCSYKGSNKYKLKDHIIRMHSSVKLKCQYCDKTYGLKYDMQKHVELKHSAVKLWNCKQCGKQFTAKRYMMAHERRHTGARNYECDICKKTFVEKYKMMCHRQGHLKPEDRDTKFNCKYCGKGFTNANYVTQHENTYTGAKPFICDVCGKPFPMHALLQRHKLTHGEEKKIHTCNIEECDKAFRTEQELKMHEELHDIHAKHACKTCGKQSSGKHKCNVYNKMEDCKAAQTLVIQQENHADGEAILPFRPGEDEPSCFLCSVCHRMFHEWKKIEMHMMQHIYEDKKPEQKDQEQEMSASD